ncbi:MAG: Gfo/Idh/MocA family oxidoreductase [Verrucomicrobia bacterium]|nr:Gfo/Idh/MocA family oxidoreductase [Verrucomicrobiota bacterium]
MNTNRQIKIGITGAGSFSECFVPLFKAHPGVSSVALAELVPDRRQAMASRFGLTATYASHAELCRSDVDAIAIFSQRHLHGPMALEALKNGKHVYCAVPIASNLDDVEAVVEAVKATGLIYMTGETSYYYPSAIFCRQKFRAGEMGRFVYGEGEYFHDMDHGFYGAFQRSGGDDWRKVAGFPPMFYPTHSTSMIMSVTGSHLTHVSCLGFRDSHDDGVFGEGKNLWDNPFSNQTALFRTSDGGACRVNEFRRIGHGVGNCVRTSMYGTLGCYEEQGNALFWTSHAYEQEDLSARLKCIYERQEGEGTPGAEFFTGTSSIHPVDRLPASFDGLPNGHSGSHQFLVDDFVRSVVEEKLPPNHVWAAARYLVPGLIAHESAKLNGEQLPIPDFGAPPADAVLLH